PVVATHVMHSCNLQEFPEIHAGFRGDQGPVFRFFSGESRGLGAGRFVLRVGRRGGTDGPRRLSCLLRRMDMKKSFAVHLTALLAFALPLPAFAAHFGQAYIDVRLIAPDSVWVEVTADREDYFNTVQTFPDVFKGSRGEF